MNIDQILAALQAKQLEYINARDALDQISTELLDLVADARTLFIAEIDRLNTKLALAGVEVGAALGTFQTKDEIVNGLLARLIDSNVTGNTIHGKTLDGKDFNIIVVQQGGPGGGGGGGGGQNEPPVGNARKKK